MSIMPTAALGLPSKLISVISRPTQSAALLSSEIVFEQHLSNAEESALSTTPVPPSPRAGQVPLPSDPASHENSSILAKLQDLKSQADPHIRAARLSIAKAVKTPIPVDDEEQPGEPEASTPQIFDTLAPIAIGVDSGISPVATEVTFKDAVPIGASTFELTVGTPNGRRPISAEKAAAASSGDKHGITGIPVDSRVAPDLLIHMNGGLRTETMSVSAVDVLSVAPTRTLDLNDSGWLEQVARDIVDAQSDQGALTFRLMPRHLGTLEIHLAQRDSGLVIEMTASNENAAQIIASAEPRFTDELRQRGVTISESSVQSGPSGDGRQARSAPNPESLLPFRETEQISHPDDDQHERRPAGRFA